MPRPIDSDREIRNDRSVAEAIEPSTGPPLLAALGSCPNVAAEAFLVW